MWVVIGAVNVLSGIQEWDPEASVWEGDNQEGA